MSGFFRTKLYKLQEEKLIKLAQENPAIMRFLTSLGIFGLGAAVGAFDGYRRGSLNGRLLLLQARELMNNNFNIRINEYKKTLSTAQLEGFEKHGDEVQTILGKLLVDKETYDLKLELKKAETEILKTEEEKAPGGFSGCDIL